MTHGEMTPERWKKIDDLFLAVSDCRPEEVEPRLASAEPEIRSIVQAMLAQNRTDFIDRPAFESDPAPEDETVATLEAGTHLGPYRIEGLLGKGGMGTVYRAFDSRLGREVAVKVLPPAFARDPEQLRLFEQEAWASGTLSHPNILTVYDVGAQDGVSYLVSELLTGKTLRETLRNGPVSRATALDYTQRIASALIAAHDKGITHCDLKPENIFLTADGRLKILDFGLARLSRGAVHSKDGVQTDGPVKRIRGTVGYMSPEQVRGEALDSRSDLFNLGLIFYELLTARRLFRGDEPLAVLDAIANADVQIAEDDPAIGPALARILRHCLERDPRERFQTAKDLVFSLQSLGDVQQPSLPPSPPPWKWLAAGGAALALAVVLTGMAVESWPKPAPQFRQLTFRLGSVYNARFTPDGQTVVYGAAWDGQPIEPYTTRVDRPESRAFGVPNSGILAVSPTGELALSLGCETLWGECHGTIGRVPLTGGAPKEVVLDGDCADWDAKGNLAIVRQQDERFRVEYPIGRVLYENTTGWISHIRFSPQGDRIAFLNHPSLSSNAGSVEVLDLKGNRKTLVSGRNGLKGLAWPPDGKEVWFSAGSTSRRPTLSAVTVDGGKERVVLQIPGWTEVVDIARDGRVLLVHQSPRARIVFHSPDMPQTQSSLDWFDWSTSADLSADGKTLLLYEWGEATGAAPITYTRKTTGGDAVQIGEGKALALSPDQKWALVMRSGPKQPRLVLLPVGPGQPVELPNPGVHEFFSAAWFPDGKRIVFVGEGADRIRRTYIQDVGGTQPPSTIAGDEVRAALVSPDGRELAAYGADGVVYRIAMQDGEAQRIRGTKPGDELIQWSSDGNSVYVRDAGDSEVDIFRIDLRTGKRVPWRQLVVPDRIGFSAIENAPGATRITPDGKSMIYTYWQARGELYVGSGLK